MNDEDSWSTFIYQVVGILEDFTGLRLSGAYTVNNDRDEAAGNKVDKPLAVAFVTSFQQFSSDYIRTHLIQMGKEYNETSDGGADLSDIIKLARSSWFDRNPVVEFGGGAGGGFQIYCDDLLVLTLGGGCGGGMFVDGVGKYLSMGGGCGGGIQIANSMDFTNSTTFYSIGGGGGCGTCLSGYTNNSAGILEDAEGLVSQVVCGDALDANATPLDDFRHILHSQYTHSHFRQLCKRVTVSAGGGGGGGYTNYTSGAASGSGMGYAFFLTTSAGRNNHHKQGSNKHKKAQDVRQVSREEFAELIASEQDGTAVTAQEPEMTAYETFSLLVQDSVANCQGAGDWACICETIHRKLRHCARDDSRNISSSTGIRNSTAAAEARSVNCNVINQFNATFASMIRNSCTNSRYANTNAENGTTYINTTDQSRSDVCSGNLSNPLYTVHSTLGSRTAWTINLYARNDSASAVYLQKLTSEQSNSVSQNAQSNVLVQPMMGISIPSQGHQRSNAFNLFELFAACTILFMMVVAWLKVFGVHVRHRYVRIPDLPDHV